MQTSDDTPFRLNGKFALKALPGFARLVERGVERALKLDELDRMYRNLAPAQGPDEFLDQVLGVFAIQVEADAAHEVPAAGPTIVVANHPFGAIEGLVLARLLRRIRPDVRILTTHFLRRVPELAELFIGVDNFGGGNALAANIGPMRNAVRWLRGGGLLLVFPAGTVSHFHLARRCVTDPVWHSSVGRLAQISRATVVPIYIHGANSQLFHLAGLVHARLRTALLPRELLNKARATLRFSVGLPIPAQELAHLSSAHEVVRYLRMRTYLLACLDACRSDPVAAATRRQAIVAPTPAMILKREVESLPGTQCLLTSGRFRVYCAQAAQMPWCMQEIGRLRESTFRAVGEGTGNATDIDLYDAYYRHLFLWDTERLAIAGAYRLGLTDVILARYGKRGLYTQSLFDCGRSVLDRVVPGIELGRSFVTPEYQRSLSALLLLWQGIGRFVAAAPRYAILFGPVSISNDYSSLSRRLLVDFLGQRSIERGISSDVKPRHPFRAKPPERWDEIDVDCIKGIDQVSRLLAQLEPDGKGVPVLLRHYLRLGGRILGFNTDKRFSDALDALILLDLRKTDPRELARYMGKDGAAAFAQYHSEDGLRQAS